MGESIRSLPVSLKELQLRVVAIPRRTPFRSAIGSRRERHALVVRWTDLDDAWGVGECSCRPDPFFNGEYLKGAIDVIRDFLYPLLPQRGTFGDVEAVVARARGWYFTRAAVLDALSDCLRRNGHNDALDQWPIAPQARAPVGISLPIFDTPQAAIDAVSEAVGKGFRRIKLKVSPGMDLKPLLALRETYPDLYLGLDANGSLTLDDEAFLETLIGCQPAVLEQPFAPGRFDLDRALRERYPGVRLCLDESITGVGSLVAAHRMNALDELNLKPGRVGGGTTVVKLLSYCNEHNIAAWVGGMFETGIGRAANLRVALRLPHAHAHDLSPPARYLVHDVVQKPLEMDAAGYVPYDDRPVQLDESALERFTVKHLVLRKT